MEYKQRDEGTDRFNTMKYFEEGNEGIVFTLDEFKELSNVLTKIK